MSGKTHRAIFLLVCCLYAFTRQLTFLSGGYECCPKPESDNRTQQETSRIQADYDIDPLGFRSCKRVRGYMVNEMVNQGLEYRGITKDRKDVKEDNSLACNRIR